MLLTHSLLYAGEWVAVDGGVIEIKLNEIEIEKDLWRYINQVSNKQFESKEIYTYQYKVVTSEEMHINALCDTWGQKDLHKEFVMVFDGGACYFQIKYNLKTGEFSNLEVNGEA